jgi:hypothetical protein
MSKRGRSCVLILCGSLLVIGIWVLPTFWTHRNEHKSQFRIAEAESIARDGRTVVAAIYQFHCERGLWPCELDDLVPEYIKRDELSNWQLAWFPDGYWHLTCYNNLADSAVRYIYRPDKEHWTITDGEYETDLDVIQPKPGATATNNQDLLINSIEEIQQRIQRYPNQIVHHKGLIAFLIRHGQLSAARAACMTCLQRWPDHWWPNAMLADIDARQGKCAEGEAHLRKWVEQYKDFARRYLLVDYLYYKADEPEKARVSLRQAARFPLDHLPIDLEAGEHLGVHAYLLAGDGLMLAYREGWFDAALAVCDRWDEYEGWDHSYLAVRSAIHLATGNYDVAAGQLTRLQGILDRRGNPDFAPILHLSELQAAISAKDKAYRYPSSNFLQTHRLQLLIDYE